MLKNARNDVLNNSDVCFLSLLMMPLRASRCSAFKELFCTKRRTVTTENSSIEKITHLPWPLFQY